MRFAFCTVSLYFKPDQHEISQPNSNHLTCICSRKVAWESVVVGIISKLPHVFTGWAGFTKSLAPACASHMPPTHKVAFLWLLAEAYLECGLLDTLTPSTHTPFAFSSWFRLSLSLSLYSSKVQETSLLCIRHRCLSNTSQEAGSEW